MPLDAVTSPKVAEICVEPGRPPVASPSLLIVAASGLLDAHTTSPDKFCVVPSEKVPVAVNCSVVPFAKVGVEGVMAIETRVAGVTVMFCVDALSPLTEADI